MKTTSEEFERWRSEPEGQNLEFKEAKNQYDQKKLCRYCVAIANEGGGKLILGVSNRKPRMVVGSKAFPDAADIQRKLFDRLHFRVEVEELLHPDGRTVIFLIPSRPTGTAYQYEGSYWMRSTEEIVPMTEDRLREIFNEMKPSWHSRIARKNCSGAEVIHLLDTQSYFDLLKRPYPADREGVLDRLKREKLITRKESSWSITNLGAILFAKKLDEFGNLSRKAPRVIVYEGTSKLKTLKDLRGTKGYAVGFGGLIQFINSQIPSNEIIEEALRKEVKMFPPIAIRELVANAMIHQNFDEMGSSIMIEIYADRMEIANPGVPPIPTDRFIDEYQSRNERLADLMRRLGICEEKGSGIDKVINAAEAFQLPAPDFRIGERHTTSILFAHKEFENMDRDDRIRACYQHCCLRYVMNEKMTNQSLRERFRLSAKKSESISRVIRETTESNLIKLSDPTVSSLRYRSYVPYWA